MFKFWLTAFYIAVLLFPSAAWAAASLMQCDGPATRLGNVLEPWSEASRTFANGKIRIVGLDTGGEPVCCSAHLAILAPDPKDELGFRQCKTLSDGAQYMGFQYINMKGIRSSYDASKGLLLSIPVERYIDGSKSNKAVIKVRINQASGAITLE